MTHLALFNAERTLFAVVVKTPPTLIDERIQQAIEEETGDSVVTLEKVTVPGKVDNDFLAKLDTGYVYKVTTQEVCEY